MQVQTGDGFSSDQYRIGFSIFTYIIYFVTSSAGGSLVVDHMASNGEEARATQRICWAFTEGGLEICRLVAGGGNSLGAWQSVSIITGVPLAVYVCFVCLSLWVTLKCEKGEFVAERYTMSSLIVVDSGN